MGASMIASSPAARSETQAVERILGRGSHVADMDTAVIKVELQCLEVRLRGGRVMLPLRRGR